MASSSSFRRVGFTFGAQVYSQVVNVGVQIALVPILLYGWGAERYGVWLLLSAIPTYLTFSDFGFTLSAKNEMTIRMAQGDKHGALVTYQSVFMLLIFVSISVSLLTFVVVFGVPLGAFLNLGDVSEIEAKTVLFLLSLNVILYQYLLLVSSCMRAAGRPAAEVVFAGTIRLLAGILTGVSALLGAGLVTVAALIVGSTVLSFAVAFFWLLSVAPDLRLGTAHASRREVSRLFHPSVSFMSQTLGQAFAINGPVMALGMVARPMDVVIFSTCRTLTRLGTTATNMIGAAMMPEYSRIFGLGNFALFRRLTFLNFLASLGIASVYFIALSLIGGWLLSLWTKGQVGIEQPFFTLLLLSVVGEMLWTALFIPLGAINRHVVTAHAYGGLALLGVVSGYFLARPYGLDGVAIPLVFVNLIMLGMSAIQLSRRTPKADEQAKNVKNTENMKKTENVWKILYLGRLTGTAIQRIRALERLGHHVTAVNPDMAIDRMNLLGIWNFHTGVLGLSWYYKNYILSQIKGMTFDFVMVDHGELIGPATLAALKNVAKVVVNYNQDNPYVARDGRKWRLFLKALPLYDLIATPRLANVDAAYRAGARCVLPVSFAADEVVHRPIELTDEDRARFSSQVVFVGSWFPERGPFLLRLIERGVPLRIYGRRWNKAPEYEKLQPYIVLGHLEGDDYAKAIRGASIAIGLLSKGNEDLHTTRSSEIPAIGTLLCAERTSDHLAMYQEGVEAVFFDGPDECADHCLSLLANPERMKQIAATGLNRVRQNGDFNEKLLTKILDAAAKASAASRADSSQKPASASLIAAGTEELTVGKSRTPQSVG